MPQSAAPQPGDIYLSFNGIDSYVEVPSIGAYSVATADALTISAWMRPDALNFPQFEVGPFGEERLHVDAQVDGLGADWSEPEAGSHRHLLLEESIVARRNPPEREGRSAG